MCVLCDQVKILPTVVCFNDGVAVHNIIGFEGLTTGLPDDKLDEWPLSNLARELALAKVQQFLLPFLVLYPVCCRGVILPFL